MSCGQFHTEIPPAFQNRSSRDPHPREHLRLQPPPSSAACPDRATSRYALRRAAAAGHCCVLGAPPALRASSGRRWRWAVAAAGRKSGLVFPLFARAVSRRTRTRCQTSGRKPRKPSRRWERLSGAVDGVRHCGERRAASRARAPPVFHVLFPVRGPRDDRLGKAWRPPVTQITACL
jgi:hypothetical protein